MNECQFRTHLWFVCSIVGAHRYLCNQDFSRVTRIADKNGQAVIFKNNRPKYLLLDLETNPQIDMTDDEKIDFVAVRILKKYKPAFLELAK